MRKFFEPKGNHGYGLALAATPNASNVVLALRTADGQGDIVTFDNAADIDTLIELLKAAKAEAFGGEGSAYYD